MTNMYKKKLTRGTDRTFRRFLAHDYRPQLAVIADQHNLLGAQDDGDQALGLGGLSGLINLGMEVTFNNQVTLDRICYRTTAVWNFILPTWRLPAVMQVQQTTSALPNTAFCASRFSRLKRDSSP